MGFGKDGAPVKKSILVVDDDREFLNLIELLLKNAGYRVRLVENAFEAMEALEASVPDAILLDIMMPMRNGFEFLENLRWEPRFEKTPVIVLSAMTLNEEEREFIDAFALAFLDKAKTPQVVDTLKKLLPG